MLIKRLVVLKKFQTKSLRVTWENIQKKYIFPIKNTILYTYNFSQWFSILLSQIFDEPGIIVKFLYGDTFYIKQHFSYKLIYLSLKVLFFKLSWIFKDYFPQACWKEVFLIECL